MLPGATEPSLLDEALNLDWTTKELKCGSGSREQDFSNILLSFLLSVLEYTWIVS